MMTKKHFESAAKIVQKHFDSDRALILTMALKATERPYKNATMVMEAFVTFFENENPRFDAMKFREACKPKRSEER